MENIIVAAQSGHAKVVIDIIEKQGRYKIVGLTDKDDKSGKEFSGYKVLGKDEDLPQLAKKYSVTGFIVGVGDNFKRHQVTEKIKNITPDLKLVSAIHPSAQLASDVKVGSGTVIMAGVVINSASKIGSSCILNTLSSLDHDCIMDDFSSLAPHAAIGGNVTIGEFSAVMLGANVINNVHIGQHTVIGTSATVLNDIGDNSLAYGIPAKVIRPREAGESYF